MRRRRRLSARYRSGYQGTKKKSYKKLLLRTAFIIVIAAVITAFAILLGVHLNKKAESAVSRTTHGIGGSTDSFVQNPGDEAPKPNGIKSVSDAKTLKITAADISLTENSADEIEKQIEELSDIYNTVSVRITNEGRLVYISPAMLEYARLPEDAASPVNQDQVSESNQSANGSSDDGDDDDISFDSPYDNLKAVVSAAKNHNLRLSALYSAAYPPSSANGNSDKSRSEYELDCIIVKELASLGFDEIIIEGITESSEDISNEEIDSIISYLAVLRNAAGEMDIGIMLPYSVYVNAPSAGDINELSEYTDLLAIRIASKADKPDEAYQSVYDGCYPLKGNFSAYNIRGVISDTAPETAEAACTALKDLTDASVQFTVYVKNPEYLSTASNTDENAGGSGVSNPNALTKNNYTAGGDNGDN